MNKKQYTDDSLLQYTDDSLLQYTDDSLLQYTDVGAVHLLSASFKPRG